ncbi:MAG TPA: BON domain-containing protein [Candidatus Polarisedimenticolia bacterium]|nr:BON domain-containing protein [Candidatus Polarisedimenticolia bacterium]
MRTAKRWKFPFLMFVVGILSIACAQPDSVITAKVKTKLAADSSVSAAQIEVSTEKHVVTLTGNINSIDEKERALEIARKTQGVAQVVDMLAVRTGAESGDAPDPSRTLGEHIDDATISAAVKTRLLGDPTVKGSTIDVDVREGVVFLTGSVRSQEESDRAVELARTTEHVRDVKPNIVVSRG